MAQRGGVDLLIVNPGHRTQAYQALGTSLAAIENPVWPGLIATHARRRGWSVELLDANAENITPRGVAARVVDHRPALVAVVVYGHNPSASTQVMPAAGEICREIKRQNAAQPVLLVGGHVAALPERTLEEEEADFVCAGEGPVTVDELLQALQSRSPRLEKVRGLLYREDGRVVVNAPAPNITDLDAETPGIAWDLLPMDRYRAHNWHCFDRITERQPYAAIYTTLGCPYKCSFCCIQAPFKSGEGALGLKPATNSYRRWSTKAVLEELETLVSRHGVRNLKLADELFVLNPTHVHGLCDGIIERGYELNVWAYARVDSVKDDMIEKLQRAGVRWLAFGIESASARVRDDVQKRFDQDEVFRVIEKVRRAGIRVIGNYIFGLPEDDFETMRETLDLAIDLNCEFANFYCAMAYPGSALYRQALAEGWDLPRSWSGYSQYAKDTLPLATRYLSGAEVLAFRDDAFQAYFTNPAYLAFIEREFGAGTRAHVEAMTAQRLEREHVAVPAR